MAITDSECRSYASNNGYYFNNNAWGKNDGTGSQCTHVDKILSPGVQWHSEWNWSGNNNNVKGYPYAGRQLSSKKIVSSIGSMPTKAEWRYLGDNIRANIAYDLFTSADANHNTYSGDSSSWFGKNDRFTSLFKSTYIEVTKSER